ncbi:MAG: hypothetical protein KME42_27420 [Tildeniella nuda ZEHNDER 1965/U140]|jgi:hypothetical protein|nr:hypothetical protein [Tildeniella nuda ZEHNDER 1965/U140]
MNNWLGIALTAYVIGAAIEGVNAASQLSHSSFDAVDRAETNASESADPPQRKWQVFTAIAAVSLCGAFLWPCRLIHRSIKDVQTCHDE